MNKPKDTLPFETRDFSIHDPGEPGRMLRGRVLRPNGAEGRRPAVLVVHGFKGFLKWGFFPTLQERLASAGYVSVAVNLSGSGVGPDLETFDQDDAFLHATPSRDVQDLERVRAAIVASSEGALEGIDPGRLALFGHSRGGGTCLLHAERVGEYRAVVTWAAVAHTNRFPAESEEDWRAKGYLEIPNARTKQIHRLGVGFLEDALANRVALDIPAACARSKTPTLLVHGTTDESVPYREGQLLAEAFPPGISELLALEGAGHTLGAVHPSRGTTPHLARALEATLDFYDRHLRPTERRT